MLVNIKCTCMKINDTEEVFQTYLHKYEDHDDDVMKVKAKVSR